MLNDILKQLQTRQSLIDGTGSTYGRIGRKLNFSSLSESTQELVVNKLVNAENDGIDLQEIDKLIANAAKMRKGFKDMGFNVIESETAIVPVVLGEDDITFKFWRALFDKGVFVNAFISPGVPVGMAMLRTSYMATHQYEHLNRILEIFGEIGKDFGVIK